MSDLIDRQAAIDALDKRFDDVPMELTTEILQLRHDLRERIPSAQPATNCSEIPNSSDDTISRQAAIDATNTHFGFNIEEEYGSAVQEVINGLPSAQPKRTCVNCGRTVNNGGWYADGRTRCPIEEHYALPKDGYCHLWEERNVTDDDYPERRIDEE